LLREYRTEAKLSQSRLADVVGLDHSYISRLEAGKRDPSRECVEDLLHELGLPLSGKKARTLLHAAGFAIGGEFLPEDLPDVFQSLFKLSRILLPSERSYMNSTLDVLAQSLEKLVADRSCVICKKPERAAGSDICRECIEKAEWREV